MALEYVGGDECNMAGWRYRVLPTRHIIKKTASNRSRRGGGGVEQGGDACVALVGEPVRRPW